MLRTVTKLGNSDQKFLKNNRADKSLQSLSCKKKHFARTRSHTACAGMVIFFFRFPWPQKEFLLQRFQT